MAAPVTSQPPAAPVILVRLFPASASPIALACARLPIDCAAARLIPGGLARELHAIPILRQGPVLTVAMRNPHDAAACARLQAHTCLRLRAVAADAEDIQRLLPDLYPPSHP